MGYLNYNIICTTGMAEGLAAQSCGNNAIGVSASWFGGVGTLTGVTINASGVCTAITFTSGKKLYPFNPYDETASFTNNGTKSKNGNKNYTEKYEGVVANWDDQTRDTLDLMISKNSVGVVKLKNGKMYLIGIDDITDPASTPGLKCNVEWLSGVSADDELSGAKFTLEGRSGIRAYRLDSSLVGSTAIFATS